MKISIAMATYNGANYIQEQLNSFVTQRRQPDELIVCDDGSSDNTLNILRHFVQAAPFVVRIFENEGNIGYVKNFEKAMLLCSGDIIFLSDQDDVWLDNKLGKVEHAFKTRPKTMVVINDQVITDSDLNNTGITKLDNTRRLGLKEAWFVTGCCTALRRDWVKVAVPIPVGITAHDVWINRLAEIVGVRFLLEQPLQLYRRHGENASEAETSEPKQVSRFKLLHTYGLRDARDGWMVAIRDLEQYEKRLDKRRQNLLQVCNQTRLDQAIASLDEKRTALRRRIELVSLPRWRRWSSLLLFWAAGGYKDMFAWNSALKDLVRP